MSRASANATVSYDAVNKRQRVVETVYLDGKNFTYDVLYLDSLKVVYRFDVQQNKCVKSEVTDVWADLGVPSTATLVKRQVSPLFPSFSPFFSEENTKMVFH